MRTVLLATSLTFLPQAAPSQAAPPPITDRIKQEGLHNSHVMAYLDYLTNSIGQRLTGSDNFDLACRWAKREFDKMGLDARLEKWAEWKVRFNRGQWSGRVETPEKLELQVATEAWTAGTKGQQTGRAVKFTDDIWALEEQSGKVEGCWLIGRPPNARSREGRAFMKHMQQFAADEGALGIVISSTGDRTFPTRIRVFGSRNMALRANSKTPTMPKIVVRMDQFDQVMKMIDGGEKVTLTFDIRNRFRREPVPLYNVIADIKGSEKPDEMVIVCGHLDSWHQATGATDNGTGVTSTMEAARILSAVGAKPKRTIRFILWGGEEQGLLGSRAYVLKHRPNMKKVSAVLNHDTGTNWAWSLAVPADMYSDFEKITQPILSMKAPDKDYKDAVFKLRKVARMGGGRGGSDHASFLAAGVPAWSWSLRGRSDYFRYTWHSQWDTFDVAIPEYQRHTSTVIAITALGIANLPHLLPRESVGRGR